MSIVCPNKNTPEWKLLVNNVGEVKAYKLFIANNNEIPSLEEINKIDYNLNRVNYNLKAVNILSSDKAEQVFEKGQKE